VILPISYGVSETFGAVLYATADQRLNNLNVVAHSISLSSSAQKSNGVPPLAAKRVRLAVRTTSQGVWTREAYPLFSSV
jgi:hypothetical protein